jgi:hypothetical protein
MVDADRNIATVSDGADRAQNAASACRLFLGELWFDVNQGIPYWQQILGYLPPSSLVIAKLQAAALTVTDVVEATVTITGFVNRTVTGSVVVSDIAGVTSQATF